MSEHRLGRAARLAGAGLAAGAGLLQLGLLLYIFAHRIGYPFDLEWMEGAMLIHVWRMQRGLPIYVEPSLDFIPFV